jgi:tRNA dimethylallyltransferase
MELGTAKPSFEERARVPHHLIDVAWPNEEYTAGDYSRAARIAVKDIAARGKVPIVAGGTGLYLRALLDGLSPVPQRDEALRDRLRRAVAMRGPALLHRVLRRLDPANAEKIHANDHPKLIRAIEVSVLEGRPMSDAWSERRPEPLQGFRTVQMGLMPDRAALYARINARCAAMFADGLVEETRMLVAKYGRACRSLQSLGYAEAQAVLCGEMTEAEAIERAQIGHRNYSKRQGTWFRRDARIHWLNDFGGNVLDTALQHIEDAFPKAEPPALK